MLRTTVHEEDSLYKPLQRFWGRLRLRCEDRSRRRATPVICQALEPRELLTNGVYHSYETLTSDLQSYAATYPAITRLLNLGQSVQGRNIWALQITDNPAVEEDEPEFEYVGSM